MELGWLSPTEFIPCSGFEHIEVAREICEKFGYGHTYAPDDALLEQGWVHITRSAFFGDYLIFWNKRLTEYQKSFLRPYMESGRVNRIYVELFEMEDY